MRERAPQIIDAVLIRPLSFVPVAVVAAPGGKDALGEALEMFVMEPARYTFARPLGAL